MLKKTVAANFRPSPGRIKRTEGGGQRHFFFEKNERAISFQIGWDTFHIRIKSQKLDMLGRQGVYSQAIILPRPAACRIAVGPHAFALPTPTGVAIHFEIDAGYWSQTFLHRQLSALWIVFYYGHISSEHTKKRVSYYWVTKALSRHWPFLPWAIFSVLALAVLVLMSCDCIRVALQASPCHCNTLSNCKSKITPVFHVFFFSEHVVWFSLASIIADQEVFAVCFRWGQSYAWHD
jgi:hypothetical protein